MTDSFVLQRSEPEKESENVESHNTILNRQTKEKENKTYPLRNPLMSPAIAHTPRREPP